MAISEKDVKRLADAEAKATMRKLQAAGATVEGMTLGDIEAVVLAAGRRFQASLMEAMAEAAGAQERGQNPRCPACGGKMRHQGYRRRSIATWAGEVRLRRAYFRCQACGQGLFPPG